MTETTKNKSEAGNDQKAEGKEFGIYLKELRKNQRMNQADLAQRIEVTSGYYGFFEQGRQIPSLKIINRLAEALNVDYLELALRAGYDEMEARKKETYRFKDASKGEGGEQVGHQGDMQEVDEGGSGAGKKAAETYQTAIQPSPPKTEAQTEDFGLSMERLDWAMGCISRDPTYKLADQFTRGELSQDVKVLVVQLYQAQTQRQLLTAEESQALSYRLHS